MSTPPEIRESPPPEEVTRGAGVICSEDARILAAAVGIETGKKS